MGDAAVHQEYQQLCKKYMAYTEQLAQLICTYDDMILQQGPMIEAKYIQAFGTLDRAVYEAFVRVSMLKRKIDLIQAYLNRNEPPDHERIELILQQELQTYQRELQRMEDWQVWSEAMMKARKLSEEESKTMKKLYHDMAKALHPDLNPAQTDAMRGLWHQVTAAYEDGDLPLLESLYDIFQARSGDMETDGSLDAWDELQQKYDSVKAKVNEYLEKLAKLEKNYPFKFEKMLRQPEKMAQRQRDMQEQIVAYGEQAEQLEEYLCLQLVPQDRVLH